MPAGRMDAGARLACAALAMLRAVAAYDNGVGARPPLSWPGALSKTRGLLAAALIVWVLELR